MKKVPLLERRKMGVLASLKLLIRVRFLDEIGDMPLHLQTRFYESYKKDKLTA